MDEQLPKVTVTGTILDPTGRPVPGEVTFYIPSGAFLPVGYIAPRHVTARLDDEGKFAIDLVPGDLEGSNPPQWPYRVTVDLEGHDTEVYRSFISKTYTEGIDFFQTINVGQLDSKVFPVQGKDGAQGPQGPKGDKGDPGGPVGPKGEQGPAGPRGERGEAGAQGARGPQGETGPAGPTGPTGASGKDGERGPKGDTGPRGPEGPRGLPGADSTVPGPEGKQGKPGPQGERGQPGPQGPKGETGPPGKDGKNGLDGEGFNAGKNHRFTGTNTFTQHLTLEQGLTARGGKFKIEDEGSIKIVTGERGDLELFFNTTDGTNPIGLYKANPSGLDDLLFYLGDKGQVECAGEIKSPTIDKLNEKIDKVKVPDDVVTHAELTDPSKGIEIVGRTALIGNLTVQQSRDEGNEDPILNIEDRTGTSFAFIDANGKTTVKPLAPGEALSVVRSDGSAPMLQVGENIPAYFPGGGLQASGSTSVRFRASGKDAMQFLDSSGDFIGGIGTGPNKFLFQINEDAVMPAGVGGEKDKRIIDVAGCANEALKRVAKAAEKEWVETQLTDLNDQVNRMAVSKPNLYIVGIDDVPDAPSKGDIRVTLS
ncbi:hypothetical protein ACWCWQ_01880 [Streptomyces sp. NPDC001571]